jgi:hypothetical protein
MFHIDVAMFHPLRKMKIHDATVSIYIHVSSMIDDDDIDDRKIGKKNVQCESSR